MAEKDQLKQMAREYISRQLNNNMFSNGLIEQNRKLKAHNAALVRAFKTRIKRKK